MTLLSKISHINVISHTTTTQKVNQVNLILIKKEMFDLFRGNSILTDSSGIVISWCRFIGCFGALFRPSENFSPYSAAKNC